MAEPLGNNPEIHEKALVVEGKRVMGALLDGLSEAFGGRIDNLEEFYFEIGDHQIVLNHKATGVRSVEINNFPVFDDGKADEYRAIVYSSWLGEDSLTVVQDEEMVPVVRQDITTATEVAEKLNIEV